MHSGTCINIHENRWDFLGRGQANISVNTFFRKLLCTCNFQECCKYLPLIAFIIVGLSFWYPFFPPPFMFETAMTSLLKKVSIKKAVSSPAVLVLFRAMFLLPRYQYTLLPGQSSIIWRDWKNQTFKINLQIIYNFTQSTALSDGYQANESLGIQLESNIALINFKKE